MTKMPLTKSTDAVHKTEGLLLTELIWRANVADELLAALIDKIGGSPVLEGIRKDALKIKHVLRGIEDT